MNEMKGESPVRTDLCCTLFLLMCVGLGSMAGARTVEFETTQVTRADVILSPDGEQLIFTMLGHLFRLPVSGGAAEQLTFGPYYNTDPAFSPDGTRVPFVSDRDGSEGNVFVLELTTGQMAQITRESWAGLPTWTPDGDAIVYLVRETARREEALVRRVTLAGGEPETLSAPPRRFGSVIYLSDGRLAWTVFEGGNGSRDRTTRIEVMSPRGTVSTLRTLEGTARRVVASPTGDGFYCRCNVPLPGRDSEDLLLFVSAPNRAERLVLPLASRWGLRPRFAVASDNKSLYLGQAGRLLKIELPSGAREPIAFSSRVKLEIQDPMPPPKPALTTGSAVALRSVLSPRMSPDGRSLVFMAAGYLWQQPLDGSQAQRFFEGSGFETEPAFSPDGRQLVFLWGKYGKREVRVFDLESRQTRTLTSGLDYWQPSWSRDGRRLVFVEYEGFAGRVVAVNLSDGKKEKLADAGFWSPRPHFSADGESLYFTANTTGTGMLYRLPLKEKAKAEPIAQLARHLSDGLVSPDGKWLAFRRNTEIWVAPLGGEPVTEADVRRFSPEGGRTFAFTPDSLALIYAAGNRAWRHPLASGEREEIPLRLALQRPTPPPLLVRRVRVIDFAAGGFGRETSLYIEQGRIRWIGSERGRMLPQEVVIVDAGGRFAIPGLFDLHVHGGGANQEAFLA